MMRLQRILFGMLVLLSQAAHAGDFFFKDGDVVVMMGDSITEQHLYSNYVEMWTVTRFPRWKLTFRNVGISGDRSVGGNARFVRDVLIHKPTAMTVDFGMNDGSYRAFGQDTFKPYMDGLQGIADQAKKASIRVAWATPQPLDTDQQGPTALTDYNLTLEKFSAGVKEIAEKNHGLFVDQFHPYLETLDKARSKGKYQRITAGDAVHPGPPGQALMAAAILKGMNFPTLVSSVAIDAGTASVANAVGCTVSEVKNEAGVLRFHRQDDALPFFPQEAASILPHAPLLESMNQYSLKVTGLADGKYAVRVGGVQLAEYQADQLAAGVNLAGPALAKGPIADQVHAVKTAIEAKNHFHHDRIFRGVVLSHVPDWVYSAISSEELESKKNTVIQERLAKLPALDAEIAKQLIAKTNVFEIAPVK